MKTHSLVTLCYLAGSIICGGALSCGQDEHFEDAIAGRTKPARVLVESSRRQMRARAALGRVAAPDKQILFGDLHVHSSYSWDGFLFTLPMVGGEGAHPPADACDFARYCSNLDFYALTDHAESLFPAHWEASKESVRQCNALAGDPTNPDLVAYTGFEWSQAGLTPEDHWGHRNVIFPETDDASLPRRPIGAGAKRELLGELGGMMKMIRWMQPTAWGRYTGYADFLETVTSWERCEEGIDTRELPPSCQEVAEDPSVLHEKLDQWGFDALEIPHGTTWGTYTPVGSDIAKHLDPEQFDPQRQVLIEIMSGHGDSEKYQSFRAVEIADDGSRICPEPTVDYLPCCWQAGEIMRSRCGDLSSEECERRVELAREYAAEADLRPHQVFPDAAPESWLDCGQCRDCVKPSFGYRPLESVQYAMALSEADAGPSSQEPLRFRYGFVASSDGHTGRPGTGYKQLERSMMTDAIGRPSSIVDRFSALAQRMDDPQMPQRPVRSVIGVRGSDMRVQSFLYPGGLAAVHAGDRSRESIWRAMKRREVYGTSGPRILLWFDLLNGGPEPMPMGSEVRLAINPRFSVRAVGSLEPSPGCPDWAREGLPAARLERLCRDECYNPSDTRRKIEAIEIVRIRPQRSASEGIDLLIDDPWLRHECSGDAAGCSFEFEDPEYAASGRDALYYARALEEASMALNGDPLFPEFDIEGRVVSVRLCRGEGGVDGCPAPVQERAWSSPIFVDQLSVVQPVVQPVVQAVVQLSADQLSALQPSADKPGM
ncbi:MAG: DUF3604 domain-containing protein [Deltaproteobacteria bacterium]|nr:DUF3604 domain-containing protein [Deltaproteobacteria bacterium]